MLSPLSTVAMALGTISLARLLAFSFAALGTRTSIAALFVLASLVVSPASSAAEPPRPTSPKLAIWSDSAHANFAAVLGVRLAEMDSPPSLLERAEISAILTEAKIGSANIGPAQAGATCRLLGADALLWLQTLELDGRSFLLARLAVAKTGLVVGWRLDAFPLPEPEAWSGLARTDIKTWLAKLEVPADRAVPVSVLGLREAGRSTSSPFGFALGRLLAANLGGHPDVCVSERTNMSDLALESFLLDTGAHPFWGAAWVVDGSFTRSANTLDLELRLRSPDGGETHIRRRGEPDAAFMAGITADLVRHIGTKPTRGVWNTEAEAREFLAEAEWAERWKLERETAAAVEAALALGLDSPEALRLRYRAYGRLAVASGANEIAARGFIGGFSWSSHAFASPGVERLEAARHALALFSDVRKGPAGAALSRTVPPIRGFQRTRPMSWHERDACELLLEIARLLYTAYRAPRLDAQELTLVRELRAGARALFEQEWRELRVLVGDAPADQLRAPDRRGRALPPSLESLPQIGLVVGSFWAEKPRDHASLARAILEHGFPEDPWLYDDLLLGMPPKTWPGWEIDWANRDATKARAAWSDLENELMSHRDLGPRLAGAMLRLSPPPWAPRLPDTEREAYEAGQIQAWHIFAQELGRLAEGTLSVRYFADALSRCDRRMPAAARADLAAGIDRLRTAKSPLSPALDALVAVLPPSAAERRAPANSPPAPPLSSSARVPKASATDTLSTVRQENLTMQAVWSQPRDPRFSPDDPPSQVNWATTDGDRLWLVISRRADPRDRPTSALVRVDLPERQNHEIFSWRLGKDAKPINPRPFPAHAILDGYLYAWENGGLVRRSLDTGKLETLTPPVDQAPRLWAAGGKLYAGLAHGGLLRIDPTDLSWRLIADSRRRPGKGILDDCPPYQLAHVWMASDGKLRAMKLASDKVYTWSGTDGDWTVHSDWENLFAGTPYDRDRALHSFRHMETAAPGHRSFGLELLLQDVGHDGRIAAGADAGALFGSAKPGAPWIFLGGMVEGESIFGLYNQPAPPGQPAHLVWMPPIPHEPVTIRLDLPPEEMARIAALYHQEDESRFFGESPRFLASPHGLFIYAPDGPAVWQIPQAALEAAGVRRPL